MISDPFVRRPIATALLALAILLSGLAPGRPAFTLMVGKSTRGNGATGSRV